MNSFNHNWKQEFEQRNGTDKVLYKGYYYYKNGAIREHGNWGKWEDPPSCKETRLRYQLIFYEVNFREAKLKFDELQQHIERQIENGRWQPSVRDFKKLEELQAEVLKYQEPYDQVQKEIEDLPKNQRSKNALGLTFEMSLKNQNRKRLSKIKSKLREVRK